MIIFITERPFPDRESSGIKFVRPFGMVASVVATAIIVDRVGPQANVLITFGEWLDQVRCRLKPECAGNMYYL